METRSRPVGRFAVVFLVTTLVASACGTITDAVDKMIAAIEETRSSIVAESESWRLELATLSDDLADLESQASADVKSLATDTLNQVRGLTTQSIDLGAARARELIAVGGAELRCNADFVKDGVVAELDHLVASLKFWQEGKQPPAKPSHAVCAVVPSAVGLRAAGTGWVIDPDKMAAGNVVGIYGYNFHPEALPKLELHDGQDSYVRDIAVAPAYVTRYEINLDLATETFDDVAVGHRIVLVWPDRDEPNTISLTLRSPEHLILANPITDPVSPIERKERTSLSVEVRNDGGTRSGEFDVVWRPDPDDDRVVSAHGGPLEPQSSTTLHFEGYQYQRAGTVPSEIWIDSGGSDRITFPVTVQSEIASVSDCRISKPFVNVPWKVYRQEACRVQPGDQVVMKEADGCVNVGGEGEEGPLVPPWRRLTTKHYVNPRPDSNHHGLIAIPGTIDQNENRKIIDFLRESQKQPIVVRGTGFILLGYEDDEYDDNTYDWIQQGDRSDPGTADQCYLERPAHVWIEIRHTR